MSKFIGESYGWAFPLIYYLFKDALTGQSIGKMLIGIRVVNDQNQAVDPIQGTIRNIFLAGSGPLYLISKWLMLAPLLVILAEYFTMVGDSNGQRIGDKIAGTKVCDLKPHISDNAFLLGSIVFYVFAIGLWLMFGAGLSRQMNSSINQPVSKSTTSQSTPTAAGSALAKATLRGMCQAAESYAQSQNGAYPSNMSFLTDANPPYFPAQYNYCGQTNAGFTYTCDMTTTGYTFKAVDSSGNMYTITTGCKSG